MARVRSALAALCLGALGATFGSPEPAHADDASAHCSLSGTGLMPIDLPIYDKAENGSPIARFTGASASIGLSDFFSGGGTRVKVKTGTGSGSFRIDGYVEVSKLSVFTKKDVAVVANHLWIASQREVLVTGTSSGKLRVKRHVGGPFDQDFTASAPCSSLSISGGTPSGWTPPGEARGYVAKKDVELYDSGEGDHSLVTILTPSSISDGILLWSTEKKGSWIHVVHHSDVVIDAWAKASDLKALPEGETMDQAMNGSSRRNPPQLQLSQMPRLVKTTKDLPIRDAASDKGAVIGKVESGTETYILDTVAGWSSVLPKALNVVPYGDGQFWVKASDL